MPGSRLLSVKSPALVTILKSIVPVNTTCCWQRRAGIGRVCSIPREGQTGENSVCVINLVGDGVTCIIHRREVDLHCVQDKPRLVVSCEPSGTISDTSITEYVATEKP